MLVVQLMVTMPEWCLLTVSLTLWKPVEDQKFGPSFFFKMFGANVLAPTVFHNGGGLNCDISNFVLVCTESADCLHREEYSVRYCTVALMYSGPLGLWLSSVCIAAQK